MKLRLLAAALAATLALSVSATPAPTELDPGTNARVVKIASMLRCLVCQNQSIADSHAEIAQDLRQQVIQQVAAGRTDKEIIDYMVSRYGDFVLYNPPFKATTAVLWIGPFALGILSLLGFFLHLRNRRRMIDEEERPLTDEEKRRASELLNAGRKH